MNKTKIYLIGIGFKPLEDEVKEILLKVPYILCFNKTLELFKKKYPIYKKISNKIKTFRNISKFIKFISQKISQNEEIAVLASGDPLYFSIGQNLISAFGKEIIKTFPDLSSLQKACSLINENWWEMPSVSFHGKPFNLQKLLQKLFLFKKIAILTDSKNNPSFIAKELSKINFKENIKVFVFEKLGLEDEKLIEGNLEKIINMNFEEPNLVILKLEDELDGIIFGLKETEIIHKKGMITKDEVRAIAIHKLRLPKEGILWDIGAGSGSISIECAKINPNLEIYAIEKDEKSCKIILENLKKFRVFNVKIIHKPAEEVLYELPQPNRVFIGGSGKRLFQILEFLVTLKKLEIIVLSAISLDTFYTAINFLERYKFKIDISQITVNRVEKLGSNNVLKALNPIFIIRAER